VAFGLSAEVATARRASRWRAHQSVVGRLHRGL